MAAPGERRYFLHLFFCIIGITVGLSVFVVFGFNFHNYNAACWGLFSGIPAAITLFVHVGCKRRRWELCADRLKVYMLTGCFIQLAGLCGFAVYLTLAITLHQELSPYDQSYYLVCVWCAMTWKWGFLLFFASRRHFRALQSSEYVSLIKEQTETGTVAVPTYVKS